MRAWVIYVIAQCQVCRSYTGWPIGHGMDTFVHTGFSSNVYSLRSSHSVPNIMLGDGSAWAALGFMPETCKNDDQNKQTARLRMENTHPLSKIGWTIDKGLTRKRCETFKAFFDDLLAQAEQTFGAEFEWPGPLEVG